MTARTRHRSRRAKSALADLPSWQSPQDRLNELTPGVTRCAWPRCREPLEVPIQGSHESLVKRYGVLCKTHALDVAAAVLREQQTHVLIEHIFTKQTTKDAVRLSEQRGARERYEAASAALRQDRDGFVYFLRVGERIKIGYSVDVKRRMREYPPGSELLAVEPGDRDLETQRHRQFAGSLLDGREWFRPTPDVLELVDEIVKTYGEPRQFAHHYRRKTEPVKVRRAS